MPREHPCGVGVCPAHPSRGVGSGVPSPSLPSEGTQNNLSQDTSFPSTSLRGLVLSEPHSHCVPQFPPSRQVQSSGHCWVPLHVPTCATAPRLAGLGLGGRLAGSPPAAGASSQHLAVADGTGGQEPPAGDGAHGARAGHRLVSPQRQRHRQRLGGHHRHGEGPDPGWEGGGGCLGEPRGASPPTPPSPPAKCHWPIFSPGAMRSRWRRLLSP